jgi:hypothetical protein
VIGAGIRRFASRISSAAIALQMTEAERFEMTPHPAEFGMYHSLCEFCFAAS